MNTWDRKIDIHAHALPVTLLHALASSGSKLFPVSEADGAFFVEGYGKLDVLLYDLEGRLESLQSRNVALQLVAPPPPLWSRPGWAAGVDDARLLNAGTREVVQASAGRIAGLAVLPLAQPEAVVEELRRVMDTGDFRAVALPTTVAGEPLDRPEFDPLFAHLSETRTVAFMHSVSSDARPLLRDYTLRTVVGWPCETAVSVARLVFAGIFERTPFPLVLSHGGGVLPFLAGRIDLGWSAPLYEHNPACSRNICRAPSTYLKELYYDSVVASAASLRFLVDWAGDDHVVFGSDFPYEIGDAEGVLAAGALDVLDAAPRNRIYAGNLAALLARRIS